MHWSVACQWLPQPEHLQNDEVDAGICRLSVATLPSAPSPILTTHPFPPEPDCKNGSDKSLGYGLKIVVAPVLLLQLSL